MQFDVRQLKTSRAAAWQHSMLRCEAWKRKKAANTTRILSRVPLTRVFLDVPSSHGGLSRMTLPRSLFASSRLMVSSMRPLSMTSQVMQHPKFLSQKNRGTTKTHCLEATFWAACGAFFWGVKARWRSSLTRIRCQ